MRPTDIQEFKRLARRLSEEGTYIAACQNGYGLMVKKNKWTKPVLKTTQEHLKRFLSADLIEIKKTGGYQISKTGKFYYRRQYSQIDPFREQHQNIEKTPEGRIKNTTETPLEWLKSRVNKGGIKFTEAEFAAGDRIRKEYELAKMNHTMSIDYEKPIVQDGRKSGKVTYDLPDFVLDTRQKLRKTLNAVGEDLADILIIVCCQLSGLEEAEKVMQWPRRSGKLVLKIALARLAQYYGWQPANRFSTSKRIRDAIE